MVQDVVENTSFPFGRSLIWKRRDANAAFREPVAIWEAACSLATLNNIHVERVKFEV